MHLYSIQGLAEGCISWHLPKRDSLRVCTLPMCDSNHRTTTDILNVLNISIRYLFVCFYSIFNGSNVHGFSDDNVIIYFFIGR